MTSTSSVTKTTNTNTMKLPVFKMRIKPDDSSAQAVEYVALVDYPANELEWFKFNKHFKFSEDKERRLIMGAFLVADMPIYRKMKMPGTDQVGEFYVVFDKETIYEIVQKYFRNGFTSNFNLMHDKRTEGVYLIESIFVDSTRGVNPPDAFKGISDGSWIATVKVDNTEVWEEYVKTGKLKGFSPEGMFGLEYVSTEDDQILDAIAEIVKVE